jgi:hypothetical protein
VQKNTNEEAKVLSIFSQKAKASPNDVIVDQAPASDEDFMSVMKRNQEIQDRLKKDRLKANHAVLKSYRIKN